MATGMSNSRQRIVFRIKRHCAPFAALKFSAESCTDVMRASRYVEALLFKEFRQRIVRLNFLIGYFRVLPYLAFRLAMGIISHLI